MTSTAGAVASREVFVFVNVDFLNRDEEPGLGNVACECPLFNLPAARYQETHPAARGREPSFVALFLGIAFSGGSKPLGQPDSRPAGLKISPKSDPRFEPSCGR